MLKKKGHLSHEKNGHFVSMGSSRVVECETVYSKTDIENGVVNEIKQMCE